MTVSFHSERVVLEYRAKIRENIPIELFLKPSSQGIRFPVTLLFPCFSPLFLCVFLSVCLFSACYVRGSIPVVTADCLWNELVSSDSDYTSARYLSPPRPRFQNSFIVCRTIRRKVKRLTVAGSRWEEGRGSSEEKKERRGEERGGIWEWPLLPYTWEPDVPPDLPGIPFSSRTDAQRTQES